MPDRRSSSALRHGREGADLRQPRHGRPVAGDVRADAADDHGSFIPGFGTHLVEHRAIDPAGNYGTPEFKATVLPGRSPACTTTLTGKRRAG